MSSSRILDEITPAQRKALVGGRAPTFIKKSDNPGATWDFIGLMRALDEVYKTVKLGLAKTASGEDPGVKNAVLVFGDQGSGKSEVVKTYAKNLAKEFPDRKYLHFNDLKSIEQTEGLIKDPSKFFVFIDLRAAQLAEHQVGGLPDPEQSRAKGFVVWSPADWTALVTNPNFAGYMFLDEMNRAPEATLNSLFGVVLDRQISGRILSNNCFIAAAANLGSRFAGLATIDPALFARFNVGTLIPDPQSWSVWAQKNGVEQAIIDFVMQDSAKNFIRNPGGEKQSVNPRNLFYASMNLKYMHYVYDNAIAAAAKDGIENPNIRQIQPYLAKFTVTGTDAPAMTGDVYTDYGRIIAQRCGEEWTNEFLQYLRNIDEFELEDVLQKLEKGHWKQKAGEKGAKEVDVGQLFYLVRFISDNIVNRYAAAWDKDDMNGKKQASEWFATTLAGLPTEQISFVLDRVVQGALETIGRNKTLSETDKANIVGDLFREAGLRLKQKGLEDAFKKVAEWMKLNKAAGGMSKSLAERTSVIKEFNELVTHNPKVSYKTKFKNFFQSSSQ